VSEHRKRVQKVVKAVAAERSFLHHFPSHGKAGRGSRHEAGQKSHKAKMISSPSGPEPQASRDRNRCHDPMREDHSLAVSCSRSRSDSLARERSVVVIWAHKRRTGAALRSMTKVTRPSKDWRVNSIGANGPSMNHSRRTGSVPRSRGPAASRRRRYGCCPSPR
jgi:hypothetical protein